MTGRTSARRSEAEHPMRLGDDEGDYYRGTFSAAGSSTGAGAKDGDDT